MIPLQFSNFPPTFICSSWSIFCSDPLLSGTDYPAADFKSQNFDTLFNAMVVLFHLRHVGLTIWGRFCPPGYRTAETVVPRVFRFPCIVTWR